MSEPHYFIPKDESTAANLAEAALEEVLSISLASMVPSAGYSLMEFGISAFSSGFSEFFSTTVKIDVGYYDSSTIRLGDRNYVIDTTLDAAIATGVADFLQDLIEKFSIKQGLSGLEAKYLGTFAAGSFGIFFSAFVDPITDTQIDSLTGDIDLNLKLFDGPGGGTGSLVEAVYSEGLGSRTPEQAVKELLEVAYDNGFTNIDENYEVAFYSDTLVTIPQFKLYEEELAQKIADAFFDGDIASFINHSSNENFIVELGAGSQQQLFIIADSNPETPYEPILKVPNSSANSDLIGFHPLNIYTGGSASGENNYSDLIIGTSGNDVLGGSQKADLHVGMEGNDTFLGGIAFGFDGLEGDVFIGGDYDEENDSTTWGIDTLDYSAALKGVAVSLDNVYKVDRHHLLDGGYARALDVSQDSLIGGTDTIKNIENLTGTSLRDIIEGSDFNNVLNAGSGDDTIIGTEGYDQINAGGGTDTLTYEYLSTPISSLVGIQAVFTGSGSLTVTKEGGTSDTVTGIEIFYGSNFGDEIFAGSSGGSVEIHGGGGDDKMSGSTGDDTLYGDNGNDRFMGELGNDTYFGGSGTDTVDYLNLSSGVTITATAEGFDVTKSGGSDIFDSIEIIRASQYADTLVSNGYKRGLAGRSGNDTYEYAVLDGSSQIVLEDANIIDPETMVHNGTNDVLDILGGFSQSDIKVKDRSDGSARVIVYETDPDDGSQKAIAKIEVSGVNGGTHGIDNVSFDGANTVAFSALTRWQEGDDDYADGSDEFLPQNGRDDADDPTGGGPGSESTRDPQTPGSHQGIDDGVATASLKTSPLILDLGGNSTIDLLSISQASAYFDIDGDGEFAENTAWVDHTSGDGFLVWDQNGDDVINGISELFGSTITEGFQELALFDSNEDGIINSLDDDWSELEIWVDANGNGYTEDTELQTLGYYNIESISLANTRIDTIVGDSLITNEGTFTYTNQTTGNISDVWFGYDNWNSVYNNFYNIDLRTFYLPNMRGFGDMADLHTAMNIDNGANGLLELVQKVALIDFETLILSDTLLPDIQNIMHRWAGVQDIAPNSRGGYVDARDLGYLETFLGEDFLQNGYNPNPQVFASYALNDVFFEAQLIFASRLLLQSSGTDLFNNTVTYSLDADTLTAPGTLSSTALLDLETLAADSNNDAVEVWKNVLFLVTAARGGDANITTADISALDTAITNSDATLDYDIIHDAFYGVETGSLDLNGTSGADTLNGSSFSDQLDGSGGDDTLNGNAGDDYIASGAGNDTSYGGDGNDEIYNYSGNDTFYGGAGADLFRSGTGNDTYIFNQGDGEDTILESYNTSATDIIEFGTGITISHLTFTRVSNEDLLIEIDSGVGGGSILIDGQFGYYAEDIEQIVFADTSTFDPLSINYTLQGIHLSETLEGVEDYSNNDFDDTIYGNGGNDWIYGYQGADNLYGGDGDDTIYAYDTSSEHNDTNAHILDGGAGNDLIRAADGADDITGGTGNDVLFGYSGNDTYYFEYGDGNDTITDDAGTDVIELGVGIVEADLSYNIVGDDLTIIIDGGAGGSITIDRQFYSAAYVVETLLLDDSTTLDLLYQDYEWSGTSGNDNMYGRDFAGSQDIIHGLDDNDNIYGYDGDDILYGDAGDDYIDAEYGDDIVYGGDGVDTIRGDYGNDILSGGDGNDDVRGGSGDDVISGGLGDDYLNGEGGYYDKVDYSNSATAVTINFQTDIATGEGTDTILKFEEADGSAYDDTFSHDYYTNAFDGKGGSDTLDYSVAYRSTYSMTVNLATGTSSGSGAAFTFTSIENVIGRTGNDSITGNSDANKLEGRNGTDTISGAAGDDLLYGGDGNDTLTGGDDADTFFFLSGETGTDTITDFTTGDGDALDISDLLSAYDAMTDLLTDFVEITDSGSDSIVKVDVDGGADSFVQIATLTGVTGLTDEDALETSGNLIVV